MDVSKYYCSIKMNGYIWNNVDEYQNNYADSFKSVGKEYMCLVYASIL